MIIQPSRGIVRPSPAQIAALTGGFQHLDGMGRGRKYGSGGGGGGDGSLHDVDSSCVYDLDATESASYGGSGQVWNNLVTSPADGSAQSVYNYNRGASSSSSTDDPTFNGTAGDNAAYWSTDGGDKFTSANGSTPTFINNLAKSSSADPCTVLITLSHANNQYSAWGTSSYPGYGISIQFYAGTWYIDRYYGSSYDRVSFSDASSYATRRVLAVAFNVRTGTCTYKRALNSRTFSSPSTFGSGTDNTNATNNAQILSTGSALADPNSRIYSVAVFNTMLSDSALSGCIDALNARHGVTYA